MSRRRLITLRDDLLRFLRGPTVSYMKRDPGAIVGGSIFLIFVISALFAGFVAPYDPYEADLANSLQPPVGFGGSWEHPLGTDAIGRDLLSRLIYGARISLSVAAVSVTLAVLVGVSLGALSGYFGGVIDEVLMRIVDFWLSFPAVLMAISLMVVLGPGYWNVVAAMTLTSWVPFARVVRGEFLTLRERPFVLAAKAIGVGNAHIIFREALPNTFPSLIVLSTFQLARNIIYEASLSFIGIGVKPPNPSWGLMLGTGRQHILDAWWIAMFPGLAITLVVLGINLLGDSLRDALDPTIKKKLGVVEVQ